MLLELTEPLADELRETLTALIGDMSTEIADTDNAAYRRIIEARRDRLRSIQARLSDSRVAQPSGPAVG